MVLHWQGGSRESVLEVIDVKSPAARPRPIMVAAFQHNPANFAVSPDGQSFAFITRGTRGGDLESVSLTTGKPIKQMPIADLDWAPDVQVAAVAYTPDGPPRQTLAAAKLLVEPVALVEDCALKTSRQKPPAGFGQRPWFSWPSGPLFVWPGVESTPITSLPSSAAIVMWPW